MSWKFKEVDELKAKLNQASVIVQIDFSENYRCHFQEEPSALYYGTCQISVHPMVAYRCDGPEDMNLLHHSFVRLSSVMQHSAPTTLASMKLLVPQLQEWAPKMKTIHIVTDLPCSQYRNRSMVKIIHPSKVILGVAVKSWNFWESGHGKGSCDSIGGPVKRSADIAVKKVSVFHQLWINIHGQRRPSQHASLS